MELCVLHYHFRPGGVRQVIESGLPALARAAGCTRITLAAGEAPPADWRARIEATLHPCAVRWLIEPALGYWSALTLSAADARAEIHSTLRSALSPDIPLWAHNLCVGRNLLLASEVAALPDNFPRWLHHHDWWWDGRWERWPEFQAQGFTTLTDAVAATLPGGDAVRHFCVNVEDARRLSGLTGGVFHFLANPLATPAVSAAEIEDARAFLRRETGAERWWLYPCRALRRKNLAEALLVQQRLAPGAVTVTTGGPSSAAEEGYFQRLTGAAAAQGWPLHAGVGTRPNCPPIPAFIAAAEAIVVTSIKEGYGLPYGEAALAGRPCYARIPFGLVETLTTMNVPFAKTWDKLPVSYKCFDAAREAARTAAGRERLHALLPDELRAAARSGMPANSSSGTIDFGALSLEAQLEVLASPVKRAAVQDVPAAPPPRLFQAPHTPESWARAFLEVTSYHAWRTGWENGAAAMMIPQLHHWLDHPLLWPESQSES